MCLYLVRVSVYYRRPTEEGSEHGVNCHVRGVRVPMCPPPCHLVPFLSLVLLAYTYNPSSIDFATVYYSLLFGILRQDRETKMS